MRYVTEPLDHRHDRGAFCCRNDIIDPFFVKRALSEHDRYKVRIKVICKEGETTPLGFYSLCVTTIGPKTIFGLSKFGERPIPAMYLAMIGVTEDAQGQGLATRLMYDAFLTTYEIAQKAGLYCLCLDAASEDKISFYERLQFQRIEDKRLKMFIPIETIADAVLHQDE